MRDGTATKDLIARTALRLFVEKGITETTVRDIATAAGVAEGTMYRHYQSKDELAWELFATNIGRLTAELDRVRSKHTTLKDRSETLIRAFCTFFDNDPIPFRYLLLTQFGLYKKFTPDMPHHFNVIREVIAEAMDKNEIPKRDSGLVASMVLGLVQQVAIYKVSGRLQGDLSSVADDLAAAGWRVLKG